MEDKNQSQGVIQLSLAMLISGTIGLFVVESGQSAINAVFFSLSDRRRGIASLHIL